jgi:hypothetical protein
MMRVIFVCCPQAISNLITGSVSASDWKNFIHVLTSIQKSKGVDENQKKILQLRNLKTNNNNNQSI